MHQTAVEKFQHVPVCYWLPCVQPQFGYESPEATLCCFCFIAEAQQPLTCPWLSYPGLQGSPALLHAASQRHSPLHSATAPASAPHCHDV